MQECFSEKVEEIRAMKTSKIFNFVARNVITVIIIALSNSLLSGDPIISITLVSAAILDYSRQLINATNKEKKAESKNGYNRKSYRLTISAANGLLFGAYLVCVRTYER